MLLHNSALTLRQTTISRLDMVDLTIYSSQELRKGKYNRINSSHPDILGTIVQLGVQVEGTASHAGVVLLPPATVEQLLTDRRRNELVQSFRLAMLKLASQVIRLPALLDVEVAGTMQFVVMTYAAAQAREQKQ